MKTITTAVLIGVFTVTIKVLLKSITQVSVGLNRFNMKQFRKKTNEALSLNSYSSFDFLSLGISVKDRIADERRSLISEVPTKVHSEITFLAARRSPRQFKEHISAIFGG